MGRMLYSLGWWVATPLLVAYLLWRARRQPHYMRHWSERWGLFRARRDSSTLLWVHAVSVGETRAVRPLVTGLLERDRSVRVLLTHMTPTGRDAGRELLNAGLGDRVVQCYLPYDYPFAVRRFLRAWRPVCGILVETEVWPNLCAAAAQAGVPLALVNARLSPRSLRKGLRWRALIQPALNSLACVVAQTEADAARIARLGRGGATVAGNLKFDVSPDEALLACGRAWREALRGRPVVLAASTRDGEEALIAEPWRACFGVAVAAGAPGATAGPPLLVVVPRHPQRFDEVAALLSRHGLRVARRSDLDDALGSLDPSSVDALLGDTMGEMFAWYAMADVAIIGGTLLPFGGQNLIEACAAGTPVILGPSTFNFEMAAEQAVREGAALRVADARAAVDAALSLLRDPTRLEGTAREARRFAALHRGATERTLRAIESILPPPGLPAPRITPS